MWDLLHALLGRYRRLSLRAKFTAQLMAFTALLFGGLVPAVVYLETRAVLGEARERGLQVTDIFAFLGAWFAGDPRSDFDGANGIQVADIFAFLSAWFTGCR